MDPAPTGLDEWSLRNLGRLAGLESTWPDAVAGPTLLHCDVRSDNLLVTNSGVVFVDWPQAAVGTAVFDVIADLVLRGGKRLRARFVLLGWLVHLWSVIDAALYRGR